jgi:hypothetical protein
MQRDNTKEQPKKITWKNNIKDQHQKKNETHSCD